MQGYLKVSNLENNVVWDKQLGDQERQEVKGYISGRRVIGIIPATLIPVRTNSLENFSKDFFLPTTVNHAIQVQHVVGKIFAILASLVLDVVTFPIRVVLCIPRIISNARQKENLLRKYLVKEGVDKKLLASDHVRVELRWERTSSLAPQTAQDGTVHQQYNHERHWQMENVNFVELPIYKDAGWFSRGTSSSSSINKFVPTDKGALACSRI